MASVIILLYRQHRHLVPKPADYATLIFVARAKFPELDGVANDNIAFHFTPEWFDGEVEMDRGAFSEVHTRAVLRITTTAPAPAQHPSNDVQAQVAGAPAPESGSSSSSSDDASPAVETTNLIPVRIHYVWTGEEFDWKLDPDEKLRSIMGQAADYFNVDRDEIWFQFRGREIFESQTPERLGIEPGDLLEAIKDEEWEEKQTYARFDPSL